MPKIEINQKTFNAEDRDAWQAAVEAAVRMNSFDVVVQADDESSFLQIFREGGKACLLQCRGEGYRWEASLSGIAGDQAREWMGLYLRKDKGFEKAVDWQKEITSRLTEEEKIIYKKLTWQKSALLTFAGVLMGSGSLLFWVKPELLNGVPRYRPYVSAGFLAAAALLAYVFRWERIHAKKLGFAFWARGIKEIAAIIVFVVLAVLGFLHKL